MLDENKAGRRDKLTKHSPIPLDCLQKIKTVMKWREKTTRHEYWGRGSICLTLPQRTGGKQSSVLHNMAQKVFDSTTASQAKDISSGCLSFHSVHEQNVF